MSESSDRRWTGAAGLAAFAAGAAGGALERGWPSASEPGAVARFVAEHQAAILGQSMAFALSAGLFLLFLGGLWSALRRVESEPSPLPQIAFGAGCTWAALQLVAQALQVGIAMAPAEVPPQALLRVMAATFSIGNFPLGVMLGAVAAASLRTRAFPAWLGWLAAGAAVAQGVLWLGTVARSGPLAPNGWLTYALYPLFALWLVPQSVVLLRRGTARAPRLHPLAVRVSLGALLIFAALNAIGGGVYGLSGAEGVPREWLRGTPFTSYFIPSLFLLVVVGGAFAVAAVAVLAGRKWARLAALIAGAITLAWIAAQVGLIGYVSWMQPATALGGLLILALAWRLRAPRDPAHA